MKRKLLRTALLLSAAGLLVAQRPAQSPVLMADDGSIIPAHRTIHRKNGETVNWSRRTTGQRSWYVKFAQSPCKEGDVFGSENGRTTCTVAVACRNTGDRLSLHSAPMPSKRNSPSTQKSSGRV